MPQRCCVPMCKTYGGHRFPRGEKRRKQWLKAICRDSLLCTDSARVCKSHFVPNDYVKDTTCGRSMLNNYAIPSVFIWSNTTIFEAKKAVWRRATVVYRKKKKNHSFVKKGKMSAVKEESNGETKIKKDAIKSDTSTEQLTKPLEEDKLSENNSDQISECRACLQQLRMDRLCSLFQGWAPMWEGFGLATIAEDLYNLSNIQFSESDLHSKFICYVCCEKLWNACRFKLLVQENDRILRERISEDSEKQSWPKPIQVDKNLNGVYENSFPFNVDIKQEVLSDEEVSHLEGFTDIPCMEIKVEPEEFIEQPQIIVNGVTSLKEFPNGELATQLRNGETKTEEELLKEVKEEPLSDVEDMELSLECLLCMRSFQSVSGLKAHVIAQHSYQTVGRKVEDAAQHRTSDKHVCATCRRTFTTPTDLMVHETCHGQHACYACGARLPSFARLSRHRARCRPLRGSGRPARPKTLDDVKRQPDEGLKDEKDDVRETNDATNPEVKEESKALSCPLCNEKFTDLYYLNIHQEVHHSSETEPVADSKSPPMEIEMLESIFNDDET